LERILFPQKGDAAIEVRFADSDGVDGNIGREQQLESVVVAVRVVLGVLPVGDQENNFAPFARPVAATVPRRRKSHR
jgi:hypothetical protein